MASDLTKWLPIWEKCDELWPRHCDDPGCGLRLCFAEADDGEDPKDIIIWAHPVQLYDMKGGKVNRQRDGEMFESHHTAAALTRDLAVWWLAEHFVERGLGHGLSLYKSVTTTCLGEVFARSKRSVAIRNDSHHSDPTEALRLAVCKVLNLDPNL